MNPKDEKILQELVDARNLSEKTEILYKQIIKKYTQYNQKTLSELFEEAEQEEEQKIKWKNRKLRKRLLGFRQYLYTNYMKSTAKMNFSKVLTIYRHYEFELHKLPPISEKQSDETVITFHDLPTLDIVRKALQITKNPHRAIILFQLTSGCSTIDTLELRIHHLLDSVSDYYQTDDVYEMIQQLNNRDDVIPCFQLKRRKTGKAYYTFCTNECFKEICSYIISRNHVTMNDRLFRVTQLHLMELFRNVNDALNLGVVNGCGYVRFRSHMLRKYHASALYNNGMSIDEVNHLQGKSKNRTDSSYFLEDPNHLKKRYVECMDVLLVNQKNVVGSYDDVDLLKKKIDELEGLLYSVLSSDELEMINRF